MDTNDPKNDQNFSTASPTATSADLATVATHQLGDTLARGKARLSELQTALAERTRECARQTDTYVRENPWKAVGWAAGIGVMLGLLIRRR